jgi:excinuclease UvrABC nuclease subunit
MRELKNAGVAEIAQVEGISLKLAEQIYQALR